MNVDGCCVSRLPDCHLAARRGLAATIPASAQNVVSTWVETRDLRSAVAARRRRYGWRVALNGGRQEQITSEGGARGFESPDGKSLLYVQRHDDPATPLLAVPLAGGSPRQLVRCIRRWFFVGPKGVYYSPCSKGESTVRLLDLATGEDRPIAALVDPDYADPAGLSISPDGTTILYTRHIRAGSDLMLIENFR